jgi:hypothetical protein
MKNWLRRVFTLCALTSSTVALAGIHLNFVPQLAPPEQFAVSIVISGTAAGGPPSIGSFDLDVSFNPAVLVPSSVSFERFLGDPTLFEALVDFVFLPGIVDLAEVSLLLPDELDALQPDTFGLANLVFDRVGVGPAELALAQILVDDAFGIKLDVAEPDTRGLLVIGALAVLAIRRSNRRKVTASRGR